MFGDWGSLIGMSEEHWKELRVPHVGTLVEGEKLATKQGWHAEVVDYSHARLGGLTAGLYRLCLMLPMERWDGKRQDLGAGIPEMAPSRLWNVLDSTVSADPCDDFKKLDRMAQMIPWSPTPRYVSRVLDPRGVAPGVALYRPVFLDGKLN